MKQLSRLEDLVPDPDNANRHTERGSAMMEQSIRDCGFGDSVTVDRNGVVISGNQRVETAADLQMLQPIVVQSDGRRPIVHQRVDLVATDPRARQLAIAQNRVGQVNLDWDVTVLRRLQDEGAVLDAWWYPNELAAIGTAASDREMASAGDVDRLDLDKRCGYVLLRYDDPDRLQALVEQLHLEDAVLRQVRGVARVTVTDGARLTTETT